MTTRLKIYDVPPRAAGAAPIPPRLRSDLRLSSDGEAAKSQARVIVDEQGFKLRSLNWAPDPGAPNMLLAYVERKG